MTKLYLLILLIFLTSCTASHKENANHAQQKQQVSTPVPVKTPELIRKLPADFQISAFKQQQPQEQADFINSLSRESKMEFLKLLLPGSEFSLAQSRLYFLKNGEFILDKVLVDRTWHIGYWEIKNSELILRKSKTFTHDDFFRDGEIWNDFNVRDFENDGVSFDFYSKEPFKVDSNYSRYSETLTYKRYPSYIRQKIQKYIDSTEK